jgi:predicted Zn-dependent protease
MEEIIGRYLPSSSWDAELEKMALFGANRTDGAYFWNALAVTQIRQERWRAAAVALSEAERISPSSPVMLYNRARLELALGDTAAARATLQAYRQSQSGRTDTGSAGGQTPRQ